jgi:hypothetical protein
MVNNAANLTFGLNPRPLQPLRERVEDPPECLPCKGFAWSEQAALEPTT